MWQARKRLQVVLVVIILAPAGVAWGQPGLRVPVMPPPPLPPPQPVFTAPVFVPPPVIPPRPIQTWPLPGVAPAAPVPAPAPVPDPAGLRWMMALAIAGGVLTGVSATLFVLTLVKLYRARTRRIRIVATPPGEAPINVRGAWVGLTLPLVPHVPAPYTAVTAGAVSGADDVPLTGYVVNGKRAVDRLAAEAPWAAAWWREHAPHVLVDNYQFLFPADVCEIV
jgi:hypothetical protein